MELLEKLFSVTYAMPHGNCLLWNPGLLWMHVVSDSLIALSYYSIPALLVYFVVKRRDIPYPWMFLLFGAFIIACGTTHILGIWTIWQPVYLIEGGVKAVTAAVSLITALLLVPVIPQALALRSPAALEAANRELEREISTRKQMEVALRESEERFRSAFDYAAIGFALVSPEGQWLKVNRSLCEIVGYSEQELMTMDFQSITHPDDLANDLAYMSQMLAERIATYQMEKRYFHKLGHMIWIQLNVSLVRDHHGKPLYFVSQIQDITERKRAEKELPKSQKSLTEAQRIAHLGSWEWDIQSNELSWSDEVYHIFALTPREFKTTHEAIETLLSRVHPEDVESIVKAAEEVLSEQKTYSIDHRIVLPNGEERMVHARAEVTFDESGSPIRMIGTLHDITERKRLEESVRENERLLQVVLDTLPVGVWIVNKDGQIIQSNPAAQEIWSGARYVGIEHQGERKGWPVSTVEPIRLEDSVIARAITMGEPSLNREVEIKCVGGTHKMVLNSALPIKNSYNEIRGAIVVSQDITERKRAEEALQTAHERLEIRVLERTAELQKTNEKLQTEIVDRKRAEEALRNSEVMYRAMYDDNPSMYFTLDAEGTVLSVNKFGMEQLGYSVEELVGHPVLRVFYEDDKKSVLESFNECLQNFGRIFQWEFRKVRKDGSVLWVREAARAVKNNQGHTVVLIVCEDITERKRTEETIRESLAQLSKKNRYETIIGTVTRSVHQSISLQNVLENAVQALRQNIHRADYTGIYIVEGEEAVLKAYTGIPDWFVQTAGRIPYLKGFTWKTIMEGKPIYCADTDQDEFIGSAGKKIGIKSYVSMQIRLEGKTVGTLNIASMQKNAFDKEELNLLEIVAHQIEVAVNNAQKADALRQSEEALRKANEELEIKVAKRTSELSSANEALQAEVTERRRAEKQIKVSLEEKEILLKEIHHRVKNNLQVISSLLSLQSRYIRDNEVVDIFRESQNRIDSMALVHEKLYQSKDMARVDFADYVLNLTSFLLSSYRVNSKGIILDFNVDNVFLGVDTAIPCGLIINELVSNSLKHGFPSIGTYAGEEMTRGEVRIDLYSDNDNRFSLVISDNGIGFPQDLDFRNTKSLGLQLVCTLTNQLNGTIELSRDGGTKFIITFSELKYKDRG